VKVEGEQAEHTLDDFNDFPGHAIVHLGGHGFLRIVG
jgi:hypothetical protein